MTRRQRRALEALVDGGHTVRQIADGASVSRSTLAKWLEDPAFCAQMRAQDALFDVCLRQRAKRLMEHALAVLEKTLQSPNACWQAKAWAVATVLRINARHSDVVIDIVTDRRFGTSSWRIVGLSKVPRQTRRLIRSAFTEPRTHGPPAA